jgi:putative endonuclease
MFYTYILENPQGKMYIGQTANVEARVVRHNRGAQKSTSNKGPWKLIFFKEFQTRSEAVKYESYLKNLKNPTYVKEHIIK